MADVEGQLVQEHAGVVSWAVHALLERGEPGARRLAALTTAGTAHHRGVWEQLWAVGTLASLARLATEEKDRSLALAFTAAVRAAEAEGFHHSQGTEAEAKRAPECPNAPEGLTAEWVAQMADAAAEGGLDFSQLRQAASLPTLAKLSTIPQLSEKACRAIVMIAAMAAPSGARSSPQLRRSKRSAAIALFSPDKSEDRPSMAQLLGEANEIVDAASASSRRYRTDIEQRLAAKEAEDVNRARAALQAAEKQLATAQTVQERELAVVVVAEAKAQLKVEEAEASEAVSPLAAPH